MNFVKEQNRDSLPSKDAKSKYTLFLIYFIELLMKKTMGEMKRVIVRQNVQLDLFKEEIR